jgi:hypothetical protein
MVPLLLMMLTKVASKALFAFICSKHGTKCFDSWKWWIIPVNSSVNSPDRFSYHQWRNKPSYTICSHSDLPLPFPNFWGTCDLKMNPLSRESQNDFGIEMLLKRSVCMLWIQLFNGIYWICNFSLALLGRIRVLVWQPEGWGLESHWDTGVFLCCIFLLISFQ